jgi:glycosyltransferase involved in cell wall biosynthesis
MQCAQVVASSVVPRVINLPDDTALNGQTFCMVTPVPLMRDSRTLKQVCSLSRWGGARVDAVAAGKVTSGDLADQNATAPPPDAPERGVALSCLWAWVRSTRQPAIIVAPFFVAWLCLFLIQTIRLSWKLPHASLFVLHGVTVYPAYVISRQRAPFVYDIHDFYCGVEPESEIGTFERVFLRPFLHFVEARCIAAAAETVTVSDGLADLIETSYGRRPTVFRNCHDSRLDRAPEKDIRAQLGLNENAFLIVVIGNHKPGQRFDELFTALAKTANNVHVALIGRGYEILAPQIAAAGLSERVHVTGALPPWSIVPSVRSANLAALPYYGRSDNYSFSLPNGFFQSVGAALPLLYPDLPEMRALAERYDTGLVVNWASAEDIAAKIAALREHPDMETRLRQNATTASKELSWENEEKSWLSLLARLVS